MCVRTPITANFTVLTWESLLRETLARDYESAFPLCDWQEDSKEHRQCDGKQAHFPLMARSGRATFWHWLPPFRAQVNVKVILVSSSCSCCCSPETPWNELVTVLSKRWTVLTTCTFLAGSQTCSHSRLFLQADRRRLITQTKRQGESCLSNWTDLFWTNFRFASKQILVCLFSDEYPVQCRPLFPHLQQCLERSARPTEETINWPIWWSWNQ